MKLTFIIICLLLTGYLSYSQQDPLYGLRNNMPLLVNPAYAGVHNHASANLNYRAQWSGFEGAPRTFAFSGYSRLGNHPAGIGLNVVSDKYGVTNNTEIQVNYGYKIETGKGQLVFGLQGGIANVETDYNALTIRDQDDLFDSDISEWMPNFGAGLIYTSSHFYAGFSIPRILNSSLDVDDLKVNYYQRHYYLTVAGLIRLGESVDFKPWAMARATEGLPMSYDLKMDFLFKNTFGAGVLTRNFNAYGLALSFVANNKLRILYQFEMPVGDTPEQGFNTHEIGLGFDFKLFESHQLYPKYF